MNLHDWIDELCDTLDIETELDEGLVGDLARIGENSVERGAGPLTTYLLGYAAALADGRPQRVEALATRVQALAESWGGTPAPDADAGSDELEVDLDGDLGADLALVDSELD